MKEPYRKGLASHPDPESCAGSSNAVREALTGAHADQPLSCEIKPFGVPTPLSEAEGHIARGAMRESPANPAQSETRSMRGRPSHRTWEIPSTLGARGASGRADAHRDGHDPAARRERLRLPRRRPRPGTTGPRHPADCTLIRTRVNG